MEQPVEDVGYTNEASLSLPRREGGYVIVHPDVDNYRQGIREIQFSVVGRLRLHRGQDHPMNMALKT